jgi:hypothetical protein
MKIALAVLIGAVCAWVYSVGQNGGAPKDESRDPGSPEHWLEADCAAHRDELERHLRGLDMAMIEIGYRFNELHFAGQDRNWPYAQYQIEKIELAMNLALERRPKRAESARPFLQETIPFVKDAIRQAEGGLPGADFERAMERLRADCMKCHVAEIVPHFTVHFPDARTSPIRPAGPDAVSE